MIHLMSFNVSIWWILIYFKYALINRDAIHARPGELINSSPGILFSFPKRSRESLTIPHRSLDDAIVAFRELEAHLDRANSNRHCEGSSRPFDRRTAYLLDG